VRVLYMGNNWLGHQLLRWLKGKGEEIVALVLHPQEKSKHREEIVESAGVAPTAIFSGPELHQPRVIQAIRDLKPDIAISVLFGYLLRKEVLSLFPAGCINIHPAMLPFNRGANPNVWSIIDGTPAGVTIHFIDEGVDTGNIIAQKLILIDSTDTGGSLYRKLELAAVDLFAETWPLIAAGRMPSVPQEPDRGTFHQVADLKAIDKIDLERAYRAKDLIDILRARTFPPYEGAYIVRDGRKIYLRLQLLDEEELKSEMKNGTVHRD